MTPLNSIIAGSAVGSLNQLRNKTVMSFGGNQIVEQARLLFKHGLAELSETLVISCKEPTHLNFVSDKIFLQDVPAKEELKKDYSLCLQKYMLGRLHILISEILDYPNTQTSSKKPKEVLFSAVLYKFQLSCVIHMVIFLQKNSLKQSYNLHY